MRYRCLILDHDDTAVDATRFVHHPAHRRTMEILRPHERAVDLETWFLKNFDPGILGFLRGELAFTDAELEVELRIWREFTAAARPPFFPGFLEMVAACRDQGMAIVVASHSEEEVIRTHYREASDGLAVEPDLVFGWDLGPGLRKPDPYPVEETIRRLGLDPREVLVVDDLKPGVDMAHAAGVDVAGACWGHSIPEIRAYMQANCTATFDTVDELASFLLG